MSDEDSRRFLLRMKFDCDFFYAIAEIEDPDERIAHVRSLGYAISDEEIRTTFGRPLPPPSTHNEGPIRETLWEEKHPKFACKAVYVGDSSALLSVSGEFDRTAAPRVRDFLDRLTGAGITDHLAVDLTACTFIDSTGLGVLVEAQKADQDTAQCSGGNGQVRSVLGMTGLETNFNICDTHEEALAALERQFGKL